MIDARLAAQRPRRRRRRPRVLAQRRPAPRRRDPAPRQHALAAAHGRAVRRARVPRRRASVARDARGARQPARRGRAHRAGVSTATGPSTMPSELRAIATGIGRIRDADTQVRALNALGAHRLSDPVTLEALARLFPTAETPGVQTAIAGVLIRANYHVLERVGAPQYAHAASACAASGESLVDVLIRRLQAAVNATVFVSRCRRSSDRSTLRMSPTRARYCARSLSLRVPHVAASPVARCRRARARCVPSFGARRRPEDGLHDHRQFARREGDAPAPPSAGPLPVRRARRARPSRLARLVVPRRRPLRRAGDLRPLRRRRRVLHRSPRPAREPAGRRARARGVQRVVPRRVLAAQGGLPLRLQHAERAAAAQRLARDGTQPRARRPFARRCGGDRARCWPSGTPKATATACATSSRTCRRSTASRARRRSDATPGRCSTAISRAAGPARSASGRPSPTLLGPFSKVGMVALPGLSECGSDRGRSGATPATSTTSALATAARIAFVHDLLRRPAAEVRMFLDPIERWSATLDRRRARRRPRAPPRWTRSRTTPRPASASSCSRATPTSRRCACA